MKETRNLFLLNGCFTDVQKVMEELKFKGVTVLSDDNVSAQAIAEAFSNNKSVVCAECPIHDVRPIPIKIIHTSAYVVLDNCINVGLGNVATQFANIADKLHCDIGDPLI